MIIKMFKVILKKILKIYYYNFIFFQLHFNINF